MDEFAYIRLNNFFRINCAEKCIFAFIIKYNSI